jgi:hypothetical protein
MADDEPPEEHGLERVAAHAGDLEAEPLHAGEERGGGRSLPGGGRQLPGSHDLPRELVALAGAALPPLLLL